MSRTRKGQRALTLTELLVVMAIIGLLAALLLPTLSRGKSKAQQIRCVSNLHQVGLALQAFLADNHAYPLGPLWAPRLERQGFGISLPATNFLKKGVWLCPAAHVSNGSMSYGYNQFGVLRTGNLTNSPGLHGHWEPGSPTMPIRESEVVAPTDMMAIGESFSGSADFMRAPSQELARLGNTFARHSGRANVLFCDGHVESPTLTFLFDDASDPALARWNRDHLPHREQLGSP